MNCESNVSIACGDSQSSDGGDALFFSLRIEIADFGLTEGVTIKVSLNALSCYHNLNTVILSVGAWSTDCLLLRSNIKPKSRSQCSFLGVLLEFFDEHPCP